MAQTMVTSPYANFTFYKDVYHGAQFSNETEFQTHAARAEEMVDVITWNRLHTMDAKFMNEDLALKVRKAVCAMAEIDALSNPAYVGANAGIQSESNDGYSVSMRSPSEIQSEYQRTMEKTAIRYLAESCLIYRGGGEWHE